MNNTELRVLIREEIKRVISSKRKRSLNENYAWQRKPGKPLPTMEDVREAYEKKMKEASEDDSWYKTDDSGPDLDSSKGGTDNSMNKAHSQLIKVQKEMDKLFSDFKAGKINKDIYVSKRKALQAKRNKLEDSLF